MNFWNSYILELQHLVVYVNNLKNKQLSIVSYYYYHLVNVRIYFCSLSFPQNGEDSGQRGIFIVYMTNHPQKIMAAKSSYDLTFLWVRKLRQQLKCLYSQLPKLDWGKSQF